jgi:hypothetical protein
MNINNEERKKSLKELKKEARLLKMRENLEKKEKQRELSLQNKQKNIKSNNTTTIIINRYIYTNLSEQDRMRKEAEDSIINVMCPSFNSSKQQVVPIFQGRFNYAVKILDIATQDEESTLVNTLNTLSVSDTNIDVNTNKTYIPPPPQCVQYSPCVPHFPPPITTLSESTNKTQVPRYRLCMSVLNKTECQYGPKCNFAHNLTELVVGECKFGNNCKFIKTCNYKHPNENPEDYYLRLVSVNQKK